MVREDEDRVQEGEKRRKKLVRKENKRDIKKED